MFHLADGMATFAITMLAGTHVMIPRFDAVALPRRDCSGTRHNVTLVPTMVAMLVNHPDAKKYDLTACGRSSSAPRRCRTPR